MTEETNQIQATQPIQSTQPQVAMKPIWLIKTEEVEEQVKEGKFKQVAWESNRQFDCMPIGLTEEMDHSEYPISIERPTGFWAPKMDWNATPHWIETASIQQGKDIETLKTQVATLKQDGQTASQDNQKIAQQVNDMSEKTETYEKQNSQQLGQLLTMVSTLIAKSGTAPAANTNQATNN